MEEVLAKPVIGRLAPSPTGALHLGNARTFMIAYLSARSRGGKVVLRMEDLDHPRDKPFAADQAIEDLRWLGFDWDEQYVQSARKDIYRSALEFLHVRGFVYPCVCSRKDVESAQSAPHAGEQLFYPGTCRGRFASYRQAEAIHPRPCWRFRVDPCSIVEFDDLFAGRQRQVVDQTLGDFPLARDEYGAGYTLAAVVDDVLMGVTEVVRGDDLLAATPAQILLARALAPWFARQMGAEVNLPKYCHVPLVVGADGRRLAKRHGDTRISAYREAGGNPKAIIGMLAASCGWCERGEEIALEELLPRFSLASIPHRPLVV